MQAPEQHAGFYGKVTTHGDFVSRRLPAAFVDRWDHWLQQRLQGSRAELGSEWLDTYLGCPLWRFALARGICDANAWAGVWMPSVDRVGRHFPLTITAATAAGSLQEPLLDWLQASAWYDHLESLALSTLQDGFVLDVFDHAVRAIEPLPDVASPTSYDTVAGMDGMWLPVAGIDQISGSIPGIHERIAAGALAGHSLWWSDGSARVDPAILMCKALPSQAQFTAMLAGHPRDRVRIAAAASA